MKEMTFAILLKRYKEQLLFGRHEGFNFNAEILLRFADLEKKVEELSDQKLNRHEEVMMWVKKAKEGERKLKVSEEIRIAEKKILIKEIEKNTELKQQAEEGEGAKEVLIKMKELALWQHYTCEDCWYSCPLSGDCCNDNKPLECDCGAEEHNQRVEQLFLDYQKKG